MNPCLWLQDRLFLFLPSTSRKPRQGDGTSELKISQCVMKSSHVGAGMCRRSSPKELPCTLGQDAPQHDKAAKLERFATETQGQVDNGSEWHQCTAPHTESAAGKQSHPSAQQAKCWAPIYGSCRRLQHPHEFAAPQSTLTGPHNEQQNTLLC